MIKLTNILSEAYGTYVKNAQNKALKRVGKKYGATIKKLTPKIKMPKFELPKSSPAHPDYKKWKAKQDVKEKQIQAKYKNIDRKPNIQNGVDVVKSGKDLEHFLNDFKHKADKVDRIDHEDFVKDQFDKNKAALPQALQQQLEEDIESWKRMGGYEAIKRAQSPRILQFIEGRNRRISDISHKTVTKVKQPIERGIMIPNKDVDKFLERFKLGEMVDIPDEGSHGSSGFSISGKTARSFSGYEYTDEGSMAEDASIIMRISPNKNGELRGLYVDGQEQSDGGGYWSEGEITRSSKSRAKCVSIKKVRYPSGKMVYVIDMQEPDDLTTESLQNEATETVDDLSRKYLEGPLNPKPRKSVKEGIIILKDLLLEIGEGSAKPYNWSVSAKPYSTWYHPDMPNDPNTSTGEKFYIKAHNYKYLWTTGSGLKYGLTVTYDNHAFNRLNKLGYWNAQFGVYGIPKQRGGLDYNIETNRKGELFNVMATIVDVMKDFLKKERNGHPKSDGWGVDVIRYEGSKARGAKSNQRNRLYAAYIKKHLPRATIKNQSGDKMEIHIK